MMFFFAVGAIFLAAGLLANLVPARIWSRMFARHSRWSNQGSTMALGIFAGLVFVGAAALLGNAGDLYAGWRSQGWPAVPGKAETGHLVEVSQVRAATPAYRAAVVYGYVFDGVTFRAERVSFGSDATSDRAWVEEQLATRYAPGAALTVHVNPADPSDAVLKPGWQGRAAVFAALGAAFVIIGGWQLRRLLTDWSGDRWVEQNVRPRRKSRK